MIRDFKAFIAALGVTDLERIISQISRLSAMSSEPDGSSSEVAFSVNDGIEGEQLREAD